VIIGAAQRNASDDTDHDPVDEMVRVAERALADAGEAAVRDALGAVRVMGGIWPYKDPGRLVAAGLGADAAWTSRTAIGGNEVYDLIGDTAARIADGSLDAALVCSSEVGRTRRRLAKRGAEASWHPERDDAVPDEGEPAYPPMMDQAMISAGVRSAPVFYALAESAIRHRRGEDAAAHLRRIGAMWASAARVAAGNPHAVLRDAPSADVIATITPANRLVAHPYPKLMTANIDVDQAAALVMVSADTATRLGVPRDRWIFPVAATGDDDEMIPTHRRALDESSAMGRSGRRALELAGVGVDDCRYLDLYSCFPAAVELAQREIGVPEDRDFTITGGLTFAGGPLNSYCLHAAATAVTLLREQPEESALLTGNGGWFSKHSALVLSGRPPAGVFRRDRRSGPTGDDVARPAPAELAEGETLTVTVEAATVSAGPAGPDGAILSCLDSDGARRWVGSTDRAVIDRILTTDSVASVATIVGGTDGIRLAG
jgi:acetyl-CoA C-acetyltransferase